MYNKYWWAGIILILALMTACGTPDAPAPTPTPTPAEAGPQVLHVYNWDNYMDPQILTDFEESFGVEIDYQIYGYSVEMLEEVLAGPVPYDVVVPADYVVEIMRREGLLAPLDRGNIPNFENIDPLFLNPTYDPGNRYCVPYQWGTLGVGYHIEATGREIESWGDVFDPESGYRVAWQGSARDGLAPILLYLGYSPNTTDPDRIWEAAAFLQEHSARIVAYTEDEAHDFLAAGEADIALAWNGDIAGMMLDDPDMRYVIPQEGAAIWVDTMCILATSERKALAEAFINYILEPEVGAALSNYLNYPTPNRAAMPHIDATALANPAIYPPDEVRARLFFLSDVGPVAMEVYDAAWAAVLDAHAGLGGQ